MQSIANTTKTTGEFVPEQDWRAHHDQAETLTTPPRPPLENAASNSQCETFALRPSPEPLDPAAQQAVHLQDLQKNGLYIAGCGNLPRIPFVFPEDSVIAAAVNAAVKKVENTQD